jgi:large subunit ribosomal protein L25
MEATNLSGNLRYRTGKGSCNALRNNQRIPGIIYGREHQNVLVEFSEMELNDVIKQYGEHALINLNLNGTNEKAMIKEVQREPVNRKITHIDMKYIKDDEKVHADIPVIIKGEDRVASRGGIVQKHIGNISVEGMPDKIPKYLVADVTQLNIGDKVIVSDVELSSDITIILDGHSIIAAITPLKETENSADDSIKEKQDTPISLIEDNKSATQEQPV